MTELVETAPAKINLTLEIVGRRPSGYHELRSLVAFAIGAEDRLRLIPGDALALDVSGPEAASLTGENLITRVLEAAATARPGLRLGRFRLHKVLPVASGVGGGSADAAAALRLVARLNGLGDPLAAFGAIAAALGADIPVCLGAAGRRAAFMTGIGETVWRPATVHLLPQTGVAAVLANPRHAVETAPVFRELAAPPLTGTGARTEPPPPRPFRDFAALITYLDSHPNDLTAPACRIAPVIVGVLDALAALPAARIARMSGSGATCFALFPTADAAAQAADALRADHPGWWIAPVILM